MFPKRSIYNIYATRYITKDDTHTPKQWIEKKELQWKYEETGCCAYSDQSPWQRCHVIPWESEQEIKRDENSAHGSFTQKYINSYIQLYERDRAAVWLVKRTWLKNLREKEKKYGLTWSYYKHYQFISVARFLRLMFNQLVLYLRYVSC